jgi:hypothetical protein
MEPDDEYLCIVPVRGKSASVLLAFGDDPILSMVLSKAFCWPPTTRSPIRRSWRRPGGAVGGAGTVRGSGLA